MPPEIIPAEYMKGPFYGLSIGVSEHRHFALEGVRPEPHQFPNLKVAAKDAQDFKDVLESKGGLPYNIRLLTNQDATREAILDAFHDLEKKCNDPAVSNPLVIVFFSGHGWVEDDRHYLIPYDARRDKLHSTALSNKQFSSMLDDLKTNRMVVFIDACHAAALAVSEGAKGELAYDVTELGEGRGRYRIASCRSDQRSWESKTSDNGVFTHHLIKLLTDGDEAIPSETIDPFNMFPLLQTRVRETVWNERHERQEPVLPDVQGAEGLTLARNHRVVNRKARERKERDDRAYALMELVCNEIMRLESGQKYIIVNHLERYVKSGIRSEKRKAFFNIFDEYVNTWDPSQPDLIHEAAELLEDRFRNPTRDRAQESVAPPVASDGFVPQVPAKPIAPDALPAALSVAASISEQRKLLSGEQSSYVLADLEASLFFKEWRQVRDVLSQAVGQKEFIKTLRGMATVTQDQELLGLLDKVADRFRECWPKAQDVSSVSTLFLNQVQR